MTIVEMLDFVEQRKDEGAQALVLELINGDAPGIYTPLGVGQIVYNLDDDDDDHTAVVFVFQRAENTRDDGGGFIKTYSLSGILYGINSIIEDGSEPLNAQVKCLLEDETKVLVFDYAIKDFGMANLLVLQGVSADAIALEYNTINPLKEWHREGFHIEIFRDYLKGLVNHFEYVQKMFGGEQK